MMRNAPSKNQKKFGLSPRGRMNRVKRAERGKEIFPHNPLITIKKENASYGLTCPGL